MSDAIPLRLLLVEDDPDTRESLVDVLELDGHHVETAATVAEALASRDWGALDAIVMDWRLPDGSAADLLPHLRESAPQATVIIVTGHADIEGTITALRGGAWDYLLKPVDADALRASLQRVAERERLARRQGEAGAAWLPGSQEADARRADERLLESERLAAIRQMITGLSHESRNALQRGQAYLEVLALELADRPQSLELLAGIQQSQDRLHRLYEEVRSYAAPIDLHKEPSDVAALLRAAWVHLGPCWAKDVRLKEGAADGVDLFCPVDRDTLGQAFRHVLENAIAACPEPGEVTATYRSGSLDGRPEGWPALEVLIRDNGPGLSSEQQARALEPFYTTKTKGTGLGLAVARRIVEAHGGWIRIGNAAGGGVQVHITLPRASGESRDEDYAGFRAPLPALPLEY
jgi:signal transduction histidine kinase